MVQTESMADARAVTVTLYHDREHPSTLYVPTGAALTVDEPVAPAGSFTPPAP